MLYQFENSMRGDALKILRGNAHKFQPHLHNSFELVVALERGLYIRVDETDYRLAEGEALLIFPDQVHEYVEAGVRSLICIFSPEFVAAYRPIFSQLIPVSNLFTPSKAFTEALGRLENENALYAQGLFYILCGKFHETAAYRKRPDGASSLIETVFRFVESNYKGVCTLEALSASTSYGYTYLSRFFKRYTGMSFIEYVNRHRVNEACFLLRDSDRTVLNVALECGFDSLRNFNRVFKRITGQTPSEYRNAAG